jgi:hypothetical protein
MNESRLGPDRLTAAFRSDAARMAATAQMVGCG